MEPGDRVYVRVPNRISREIFKIHELQVGTIITPDECTTCQEPFVVLRCSEMPDTVPVLLDRENDGKEWIAHYPPGWLFEVHYA